MRDWLPAILSAALFLGTGGCTDKPAPGGNAGNAPQTTGAKVGGRVFGVSFQTMNNPFFVELGNGLREVVEKHGDRLVVLDAQWNSLKQKNDISDLLLQGAEGVFINPVNWEGIEGSLLQANDKKIPCIVVDAPANNPELVVCTVASDNVDAGRQAARHLAKVRPKAKVVILHLAVNKACIDRVAGFKEELAKHPDIEVLDIQEGKGTIEGSRPVMRDLLGRYPQLDAVFPINDPSALGAISALESVGKADKVTVVTVDGSAAAVAAIKEGKLAASTAQFPHEIGRAAAQAMYDHLDGKAGPKEVKIPVELINKDNVGKFADKQF